MSPFFCCTSYHVQTCQKDFFVFSVNINSPILWVTVSEAFCKGVTGYLQLGDLKSQQESQNNRLNATDYVLLELFSIVDVIVEELNITAAIVA